MCIRDRLLGMGFFVFAPIFLFRLGIITPHIGHFLILLSLYFSLKAINKNSSFYWGILLTIALLVNFYLFCMAAALYFASLCDRLLLHANPPLFSSSFPKISISSTVLFFTPIRVAILIEVLLMGVFLWLVFWQVGYLEVTSLSTGNYGIGRINLLALIDPDTWSYILPNIPDVPDPVEPLARAFESFAYLGLGSIFLALLGFIAWLMSRVALKPIYLRYRSLVWALLALSLFAISNQVALGPYGFVVPIPDSVRNAASILRASARLFWPVYYAVLLTILYLVMRGYSKKTATLFLAVGLLIQIVDTSAGWLPKRKTLFMQTPASVMGTPLQSPFWAEAAKHYQNIVIVLPQDGGSIDWKVFADYAAKYHLKTNSAYLGRYDANKINQSKVKLITLLQTGFYDQKSLYVIADDKIIRTLQHLNKSVDLLARIDGFNVLAPGWVACALCIQLPYTDLVQNLIPSLNLNTPFLFSRAGKKLKPYVLVNGWTYPENWGVWSMDNHARLILPLPQYLPVSSLMKNRKVQASYVVMDVRAIVNSQHPTSHLNIVVNEKQVQKLNLTQGDQNYITIPITAAIQEAGFLQLDFEFLNPIRPKDIGMGNDDRRLSIGLISATFH